MPSCEDALLGLADMPERHRVDERTGHRRVYLRSYPYVVWFRVEGQTVQAVTLTHERMAPDHVLRLVSDDSGEHRHDV